MTIAKNATRRTLLKFAGAVAAATIFASCAPFAGNAAPATADTAFVGVNVVPMTDGNVLRDQTVLIKAGRIEAIGPRTSVAVPAGAKVIGQSGAWLMPGLVDTHVHLQDTPQALDLFLANGVTTVRDLGGSAEYLRWAAEIEQGKRQGPTLLMTGPIIHSTMGEGAGAYKVETAEDGRAEVERQWNAGFRSIKLYTELSADAYHGAIAEAQRRGMYVTGHIPDSVGLSGIIAAGQKEIAHTEELRSEFMVGYDPTKMFSRWPMDAGKIGPVAAQMARAGVADVTSLSTVQALYDQTSDIQAVLARPEIAYQHPYATAEMRAPGYDYANRLPADYLGDVIVPHFQAVVRGLEAAGVPLLLGTDSGLSGVVWGWGTHRELELLVTAGLSPYQALKTATATPARIIPGIADRGVVRVGARADLLLISGNPLEKIANTQAIIGIMQAGHWIDQRARQRILAEAKVSIAKLDDGQTPQTGK